MIRQSELAKILAEKHNISLNQADVFLNAFVKVLLSSLEIDESVKIKGLGTFRIIRVKDRESVKVNTGERYIIYGHSKIGFTPEATLRDLVNHPFSQFESVVLNDGVTFDDMDEGEDKADELIDEGEGKDKDKDKADDNSNDLNEEQNSNMSNTVSLLTDEDIEGENYEGNEVIKNDVEEIGDIDSRKEIDENNKQELVDTGMEITDNSNDDVEQPKENEEGIASAFTESIEVSNSSDNEIAEKSLYIDEKDTFRKSHVSISSIIFAVLCGLVGGYLIGHYAVPPSPAVVYVEQTIDSLLIQNDTVIDKTNEKNVKEVTKKVEKHAESEQPDNKQNNKDNANVTKQTAQTTQTKKYNQAVDKNASSSQEQYEAMYPAIRYGAYRIEGVDKSVTVKKGQTLYSISKAHLGPDMECYVIALNDGKKTYNEGDVIKIPKLKLKKAFKKR